MSQSEMKDMQKQDQLEEPFTPTIDIDVGVTIPGDIIDADLDKKYKRVYHYYSERGFWIIVISKLFRLFARLFIITVLYLTLNHLNLVELLTCAPSQCNSVPIFTFDGYTFLNWINLIFIIIPLFGYLLFKIFKFVVMIKPLLETRKYVNKFLGFKDEDLVHLSWSDIVSRIVEQNKKSVNREENLDELDITAVVLRYDNFLIAFEHSLLLNLKLPFVGGRVMTESLVLNLKKILEELFIGSRIRREIFVNHKIVRWLFIKYGLINFAMMPILLVFNFFKVFLKYFAEIQNNSSWIMKKRWTTTALWKFRAFNETEVEFTNRIAKSFKYAEKYLNQFPNHLVSTLCKNIMFFASSLLACIVVLTTLKNSLLTESTIFGQNLLWWSVVICSAFVALTSSVVGKYNVSNPKKYMKKLNKRLRFIPNRMVEKSNYKFVKSELSNYYTSTLSWFLVEISSIVLTPVMLFFMLSREAENIAKYFQAMSVNDPKIGTICGYCTFKEKWEEININYVKDNLISLDSKTKMSISKQIYVENHHNKEKETEISKRTPSDILQEIYSGKKGDVVISIDDVVDNKKTKPKRVFDSQLLVNKIDNMELGESIMPKSQTPPSPNFENYDDEEDLKSPFVDEKKNFNEK